MSPLLPLGGGVFALASLYILLYALNNAALDRYAIGFVVHTCPVCGHGSLEVEERPYRSVGIPRVRRTVRCDSCRSVLREVGRKRWRYAVDPLANPALYETYNGKTLSEAELQSLATSTGDGNQQTRYVED
jgi:hypothetical protein